MRTGAGWGANVRFCFDAERLTAFREVFPDGRWKKDNRTWDADGRVNLWMAERRWHERKAVEAAERAAEGNGIEHPRVSRLPEG